MQKEIEKLKLTNNSSIDTSTLSINTTTTSAILDE